MEKQLFKDLMDSLEEGVKYMRWIEGKEEFFTFLDGKFTITIDLAGNALLSDDVIAVFVVKSGDQYLVDHGTCDGSSEKFSASQLELRKRYGISDRLFSYQDQIIQLNIDLEQAWLNKS